MEEKLLAKTTNSTYGFQDFIKSQIILKVNTFFNDTRYETNEELMYRIETEMKQFNRQIINFETIIKGYSEYKVAFELSNQIVPHYDNQIIRVWYKKEKSL